MDGAPDPLGLSLGEQATATATTNGRVRQLGVYGLFQERW
jgi:hypothetical protein